MSGGVAAQSRRGFVDDVGMGRGQRHGYTLHDEPASCIGNHSSLLKIKD